MTPSTLFPYHPQHQLEWLHHNHWGLQNCPYHQYQNNVAQNTATLGRPYCDKIENNTSQILSFLESCPTTTISKEHHKRYKDTLKKSLQWNQLLTCSQQTTVALNLWDRRLGLVIILFSWLVWCLLWIYVADTFVVLLTLFNLLASSLSVESCQRIKGRKERDKDTF